MVRTEQSEEERDSAGIWNSEKLTILSTQNYYNKR